MVMPKPNRRTITYLVYEPVLYLVSLWQICSSKVGIQIVDLKSGRAPLRSIVIFYNSLSGNKTSLWSNLTMLFDVLIKKFKLYLYFLYVYSVHKYLK